MVQLISKAFEHKLQKIFNISLIMTKKSKEKLSIYHHYNSKHTFTESIYWVELLCLISPRIRFLCLPTDDDYKSLEEQSQLTQI